MLMMLGVGAACSSGKKGPADAHDAGHGRGLWEKGLTADAHDAGSARGLWEQKARLMLRMLGVGGLWEKRGTVDADDAGHGRGLWEKEGPADAHDAGCGCGLWVWVRLVGKRRPS